jgi:hypothetical protein
MPGYARSHFFATTSERSLKFPPKGHRLFHSRMPHVALQWTFV